MRNKKIKVCGVAAALLFTSWLLTLVSATLQESYMDFAQLIMVLVGTAVGTHVVTDIAKSKPGGSKDGGSA